ncbi:MAG: zinc dependent phospholipase C family protein [Clostridiaceae bacterium]|nr:zinc dependent phospholipase C family protein [Clostridiaceae bacterium]
MNIIVHLMFAVTLRSQIKKKMGISLNLRGFLFGNILPDISRKYGQHPHYMKDALWHVAESKDNLLFKSSEPFYSYHFAKKLGAVNHYLSDFFCLPHTEGYKGSKAHHGYYELMMIARYRKGLKAYRKLLREQDSDLNHRDLISFIVENNKAYSERKASDINDIRYALYAGTKFNEYILAHSTAAACKNGNFDCLPEAQAI